MTRLISWLLNVVYLALLVICAPLILWPAIRTGKYRDGYREKFLGLVPRRDGRRDLRLASRRQRRRSESARHAAPRAARTRHPDWQFVVSTTSRTGYELARKKYADLTVFYCPLDFSWAVRTAMRRDPADAAGARRAGALAEPDRWRRKGTGPASPSSTAG